ncbi:S66 peptidase family protein [Rhinopithecimicrobium faecis]
MMKIPEFLQPGDKVAIVCPASFIRGDISKGIAILESWGLEVHVGETVDSQFHQFAGDDTLRAADFQWALNHPEIKAVFAARGGYGSVRIIDKIDFSIFQKQPKWVIGFSDITVFHTHINRRYNCATIHGQMPKSFETGTPASLETLRQALFGEAVSYTFSKNPLNKGFIGREATIKGRLIGGNLAILHSLVGSVSEPKYKNKILFIEDVGETFYNVDRMLWTLKRAGHLKKLKGIIVGGFSGMRDNSPAYGYSIEEIILEKVQEYDYPVVFDFPAGHIDDNHALIFGQKVALETVGDICRVSYSD